MTSAMIDHMIYAYTALVADRVKAIAKVCEQAMDTRYSDEWVGNALRAALRGEKLIVHE